MRIGMQLNYRQGFVESIGELREFEREGLGVIFVSELYSFDAVSQLGYIAAKTDKIEIASGILPIYSRTPTLTAMTAAGLDYVSGGRFTLGIGVSGPQVIEGFHGVPHNAPLGRTREVIEICRKVWKRESLAYEGRHYTVPLPAGKGTGLGKSLKLLNHPVRDRIPIMLAATGPRNVELAAEIADAWEPIFFHPHKADSVFGDALRRGKKSRSPELGEMGICVEVTAAVGDDVEAAMVTARERLALYVGGMGAKGKNYYNDLACQYGYEKEAELVQDLFLAGRKREAAAAIPDELVRAVSLIGTVGEVKDQLEAFARAGVTTLLISPAGLADSSKENRLDLVRTLVAMAK